MARQEVVQLVDDLDGSEAVETVEFSIDGKVLQIDLNKEHADGLREAFAPYLAAARRAGGSQRRATTTAPVSPKRDMGPVRQWLNDQGHQVSERGRISNELIKLYEERNSTSPVADEPRRKRGKASKPAEAGPEHDEGHLSDEQIAAAMDSNVVEFRSAG